MSYKEDMAIEFALKENDIETLKHKINNNKLSNTILQKILSYSIERKCKDIYLNIITNKELLRKFDSNLVNQVLLSALKLEFSEFLIIFNNIQNKKLLAHDYGGVIVKAISSGNLEVVKFFIENKDKFSFSFIGYNHIISLSMFSENLEVTKYLLNNENAKAIFANYENDIEHFHEAFLLANKMKNMEVLVSFIGLLHNNNELLHINSYTTIIMDAIQKKDLELTQLLYSNLASIYSNDFPSIKENTNYEMYLNAGYAGAIEILSWLLKDEKIINTKGDKFYNKTLEILKSTSIEIVVTMEYLIFNNLLPLNNEITQQINLNTYYEEINNFISLKNNYNILSNIKTNESKCNKLKL